MMSLPAGIVLGVLIGWLVEWAIDWLYWRPKWAAAAPAKPETQAAVYQAPDRSTEIEDLKTENARLKKQVEGFTRAPDDLKVIKGIGPEIEHRLNQSGIVSFAQLSQLTPYDLECILGDAIKRLANEQSLIDQARQLAGQKE